MDVVDSSVLPATADFSFMGWDLRLFARADYLTAASIDIYPPANVEFSSSTPITFGPASGASFIGNVIPDLILGNQWKSWEYDGTQESDEENLFQSSPPGPWIVKQDNSPVAELYYGFAPPVDAGVITVPISCRHPRNCC